MNKKLALLLILSLSGCEDFNNRDSDKAECESKGFIYYKAYKTSPICVSGERIRSNHE